MSLTDMVIMPGVDYQAICDSVRAKTGDTAILKSGQIPELIDGISGESSIEDICKKAPSGDIVLPTLEAYDSYYFRNSDITSFSAPELVFTNKYYMFEYCSKLAEVSLPKFTGVGKPGMPGRMFSECTALVSLNLPALKRFGVDSFCKNCTNLEELRTPTVEGNPGQYTVSGCKKLKLWDAGFIANLTGYACLASTPELNVLILRNTILVPIYNATSSMTANGCTVYVPEALIADYRAATNWSALYAAGTCTFVAIEGSEYE